MSYQKEIRDGKEVVVISTEDFNKQFNKKRVSAKQKIMEENEIDLKYLKRIQYKKKEGTFSFKIMGIPNVETLKQLIKQDEVYGLFSFNITTTSVNQLLKDFDEKYDMSSINMNMLKKLITKPEKTELSESVKKLEEDEMLKTLEEHQKSGKLIDGEMLEKLGVNETLKKIIEREVLKKDWESKKSAEAYILKKLASYGNIEANTFQDTIDEVTAVLGKETYNPKN